MTEFEVNDFVVKDKGDYRYYGWVVAKFNKLGPTRKLDGPLRYVVQSRDGLLMIMSPEQLRPGMEATIAPARVPEEGPRDPQT